MMIDLIDRQTIIETIHKAIYPYFCGAEDGDILNEDEKLVLSVNKAVCTAIKALPSADIDLSNFSDKLWAAAYERGKIEAQQRWIPCSERLPTKKTEVIYSLENHYVSTGYMTDRDYNGDEMELHWEDMESGALIYPEAWMPLPEPYKGGQDD